MKLFNFFNFEMQKIMNIIFLFSYFINFFNFQEKTIIIFFNNRDNYSNDFKF